MKIKPLAECELQVDQEWVKSALKKKIIEEFNSSWRSCLFPVRRSNMRKKEGTIEKQYRIVTPFFGSYKCLSLRPTSPPTINDVRNGIRKAKLFILLVLKKVSS